MTPGLLGLYHKLPGSLRDVAASLRGAYLKSWRYGPETGALVEAALQREHWTNDQWNEWRKQRLAMVLERAVTRVPYYRNQWAVRRQRGEFDWQDLANWPILEKDQVRRWATELVAEDCARDKMFAEHTSGTSGKSLNLWWSRQTVRAWYALFEARSRGWYGLSRHDRWAILGGQLVTAQQATKPPFWTWNSSLNQLYMSSYHLAQPFIPYYLEALKDYKVRYIFGYSSSLNTLAQEALRIGWKSPHMQVAITNAEPLFPHQRHAIQEAFGCPVQETYGLAEIVAAASECPEGRLHVWPEAGFLETAENGDLLATSLLNVDQPLIRYRVGDRVEFDLDGVCACGRTLPLIRRIEGRVDDIVYTADGRAVGRLDPVFKADLPIVEAQIIQESLEHIRILVVPTDGFDDDVQAGLRQRIRDRLGKVSVSIETVVAIPRHANGKFRAVISRIKQAKPA